MRIVVITPEGPAHARSFVARLAESHELVGAIHPAPRRVGLRAKLTKGRKELAGSGAVSTLLRASAAAPGSLSGWRPDEELDDAEARFFTAAASAYDALVAPVAHRVADVNADTTVDLVRRLEPQAIACLGGPIYRRRLIEACPLMVNYHSGLSPLYNGTSSIQFAFANGHFHLCGGTLMTMSHTVDGGDILAHFLPTIEDGDTPATLFMKTVEGAAQLTARFLDHLGHAETFARAAQPPPLFYTTGGDWTLYQSRNVARYLTRGAVSAFARDEEFIEYYTRSDDAEAREAVRHTVDRLLGLA